MMHRTTSVRPCLEEAEEGRSFMIAFWPVLCMGYMLLALLVEPLTSDLLSRATLFATLCTAGFYALCFLGARYKWGEVGRRYRLQYQILRQWEVDQIPSLLWGAVLSLLLYLINNGWALSFVDSLPVLGVILFLLGVFHFRKRIFDYKII